MFGTHTYAVKARLLGINIETDQLHYHGVGRKCKAGIGKTPGREPDTIAGGPKVKGRDGKVPRYSKLAIQASSALD